MFQPAQMQHAVPAAIHAGRRVAGRGYGSDRYESRRELNWEAWPRLSWESLLPRRAFCANRVRESELRQFAPA
jgi:hypothetical protein